MRWGFTAARISGTFITAVLVTACAAAPIPPLVEAAPPPLETPAPPAPIAEDCHCDPGLVCCNESCGICAQPGEPCPAIACRR